MEIDTPSKQLFFTTVRIDAEFADLEEPYGNGTAFIYNVSSVRGDEVIPFIVTNRHVIEDIKTKTIATRVTVTMLLRRPDGSPHLGQSKSFEIDNVADAFTFHPDSEIDIAVLPLMPLVEGFLNDRGQLFYRALSIDVTPKESEMADLDAIEDITFIGYPDGRFDAHNETPVARHGATATPIHWDWQGAKKFLIDASVFPGSSGSPVFIVHRNGYKQGSNFLLDASRVLFVGILSEVYLHGADVEYAVSRRPVSEVHEVLDLGVVYRWELIEATIDASCERFSIARAAADDQPKGVSDGQ